MIVNPHLVDRGHLGVRELVAVRGDVIFPHEAEVVQHCVVGA